MRTKILILLLVVTSCKNQTKNNLEKSSKENNLSQIQGLWKSFSYYLEHEEDDKDEHKNEYYKIVSGDRSLDIILKNQDNDSIIYKTYKLGFINGKNEYKKGLEKPFLKSKGSFLVKELKKVYRKEGEVQNFFDEFKVSQNIERYYDIYELLDDGFNYENFGVVEKVQFKKISTLPVDIYRELKEASRKSLINYIENFNIKELSSTVRVTVPKCYFYEDEDLKIKKRAFLIKNDKAYLEEANDKSVKVYFDGKILTSGYLDKSEVKVVVK